MKKFNIIFLKYFLFAIFITIFSYNYSPKFEFEEKNDVLILDDKSFNNAIL